MSWMLQRSWSAIVESITMWLRCSATVYTGFLCSTISTINLPCSSTSLFMVLRRNTLNNTESGCLHREREHVYDPRLRAIWKSENRRPVLAIAPFLLPVVLEQLSNIHTLSIHPGLFQVQTQVTLFREGYLWHCVVVFVKTPCNGICCVMAA